MAIRYSGDVEVRLSCKGRIMTALIRAPKVRMGTRMLLPARTRLTSEVYDRIAVKVLTAAWRRRRSLPVERKGSRVLVRRMFISPCPWKV